MSGGAGTASSTAAPRSTRPLDAYERWLQARAMQQELNAYELFGLPALEASGSKIKAIVERQEQAIEAHRDTAAPELWARFATQFQDAKESLQSSERKSILDAALRRQGIRGATELAGGDSHGTSVAESRADRAGQVAPCPNCARENPADRKFCAGCGESLYESCPKCRESRLRADKFCGHCGLDVERFLADRAAHFDAQFAEARRLQAAAQFADARRIARDLAQLDDPRFESYARAASDLLQEFSVDQKRQTQEATESIERAGQLLEANAYEAALQALANLPATLETAESNRIRQEATTRQREAESLLQRIKEGLDKKQTAPLLPLLERFLKLKPNHAQATKLARQIADQLIAQARRAAEQRQLDDALKILLGLPEFALTDDARKLIEDCEERAWLLRETQRGSVLHPSLPALADRAVEMSGGQEELKQLAAKIRERQAASPRERWLAVPDWAAAPQRTALGMPVDWLGGWCEIQLGEKVKLPLPKTSLSRLNVALGLALQALGKGAVDVNLAEDSSKQGLLGRLTGGFRKRAPVSAWGIDLSATALKAVQLRWDESRRQVIVEACEVLEREPRVDSGDEAGLRDGQVEMLKLLASKHSLAEQRVAVNLPPLVTLARMLVVPLAAGKKFDEMVRYEARQQIPLPLEDLSWESIDLRDEATRTAKDSSGSARVLIAAAKRSIVAGRVELFSQAGIKPEIVQLDCIALHNFIRFDLGEALAKFDPKLADRPLAMIDVGADATSFLVSGPKHLWFRTFSLGGDDFTRSLIREFKLVRKQAEDAKRNPHRVRKLASLAAAWERQFEQLRNECHRSLEQWKSIDATAAPARLLCSGGGTPTFGLVQALRGG